MTRHQQRRTNSNTIQLVASLMARTTRRASYKTIVAALNAQKLKTTRGNPWTPKRLFRMLQRNHIRGLWGLAKQS